MKVLEDLCKHIEDVRSGFDTVTGTERYLLLHASLSKIGECLTYIKYNEDYIDHMVFVETFKPLLTI